MSNPFIVFGAVLAILIGLVFAAVRLWAADGGWWKFAGIFTAACVVYYIAFPYWVVRHRWTYEVEVDGTVHTGSGVMETTTSTGLLCGGPGIGYPCQSFRGEAVPIDLGSRGTIFALLVSPNGGDSHVMLAPEQIANRLGLLKAWARQGRDNRVTAWAGLAQQGLKAELLVEEIPMLVRFEDVKDRMSVERIDPTNFAAALGSGVTLKRATLETTSDTISTGVEKILPWLPGLKGRPGYATAELPEGNAIPPEAEHRIHGTAFSTELYK